MILEGTPDSVPDEDPGIHALRTDLNVPKYKTTDLEEDRGVTAHKKSTRVWGLRNCCCFWLDSEMGSMSRLTYGANAPEWNLETCCSYCIGKCCRGLLGVVVSWTFV